MATCERETARRQGGKCRDWLTSEEDRRAGLVPFLNNYNHDRPHSSIGNRPPITRAPTPGPRLIPGEPVVAPPTRGQMVLDLTHDTNLS